MVSWWLLELGQRMIKSNKKKKTLFLINHKKNEEMNGLQYKKLNDFEMSNITGGKWVTKTIVASECIGRDIYGNCNQFHVFTYTYEYNTKTHEERNKHRDTYNPE